MPIISLNGELKVICHVCRKDLEESIVTSGASTVGTIQFEIKPCPHCLKTARVETIRPIPFILRTAGIGGM